MAEVLSQKQIDELLGSLKSGDVDFKEIEEQTTSKKIKEYDFMSPKKFTREQFKLLDSVFDNFARMFSLHLTSMLRTSCQMEVLQIEEEEFREFNNALSDNVLVGVISIRNDECKIEDKPILLEMSRPISFSIMDRLLGGNGEGYIIERNYTEIEIALLEFLFKQVVTLMKNAWSNYYEIEHTLNMIETNSRMIQMIQPDESVAIVVVEIALKNLKGNVNICLPAASLEEIFKAFNSKYTKSPKKGNAETDRQRKDYILQNLKTSPLTISAILGKAEITLQDILTMQSGDIIPLNTQASENSIIVKVEDTPWFTGGLGVKKKNYAVRINDIMNT